MHWWGKKPFSYQVVIMFWIKENPSNAYLPYILYEIIDKFHVQICRFAIVVDPLIIGPVIDQN